MPTAVQGGCSSAPGGGDRLHSVDAVLSEHAGKSLQPKPRELLRWHSTREASSGMICRRIEIALQPTSIFDIELVRAERRFGNALQALGVLAPSFVTSTQASTHAHAHVRRVA